MEKEELELVTLNAKWDQSRPPEPVDARKSSTNASQLPITDGDEIRTTGLRGRSGARTTTDAEADSAFQLRHNEVFRCVHIAFSSDLDAILIRSPTAIKLLPDGYRVTVDGSAQSHCASSQPKELNV